LLQEQVEELVVRHLTSASFLATTDKTGAQPAAPVTGSVSGTVGDTTLSTPVIPSHSHPAAQQNQNQGGPAQANNRGYSSPSSTGATGGGGAHSHPFSGSLSSATADVSVTVPAANVKYANVIVATKD
jgi:hypothetical protein